MQPADALDLARCLIGAYPDLNGWEVEFSNRAVLSLGVCIHKRRVIRLSRPLIELNGEDLIVNTFRHEVAHARVGPGHGHDAVWKQMAILVGAEPIRCARNVILVPGRWAATCPLCKRPYSRYRKPDSKCSYFCTACGPVKGFLRFDATRPELIMTTDHLAARES